MTRAKPAKSDRRPPQLDSIETSVDRPIPQDYKIWRNARDPLAYDAALELYSNIDEIEGSHRAEHLKECRTYAYFAYQKETRQVRVISNACRLRWCPVCAEARYMHIRSMVREWVLSVRSPKLLTLTMRHTDTPLATQIHNLYKHFRNFRLQKLITRKIRGGVWFFQLKRSGKTGEWHPHLHCLIDADYIDKIKLSLDWQRTTGDSFIVDIRGVKDPQKVSNYVSRYCARPAKLAEFTPDDKTQVFTVCHSRRLAGTWGSGRRVRFNVRPTDEVTEWMRLGSWADIVAESRYSPSARRILKAFFTSTPLSEADLRAWQSPIDDLGYQRDEMVLVAETKQLQFKEFK
jgi:hypothetical protein